MKKTSAEIDAVTDYPNRKDKASPLSLGGQMRQSVERECDAIDNHKKWKEWKREYGTEPKHD